MVIKFISKALKRDKNALIVHKTDDEITRFVKQNRKIKEMLRFEQIMKDVDEKRLKGLNVEEKIKLHHAKLDLLNSNVYDKTHINDNLMNFDHLSNK